MAQIEVAAYYFPSWHRDPRNDKWHGEGWTEWDLVQAARPRFPGHRQPITPAWGYANESDPKVMAKEIDLAASHGITAFLFDYYHYDDGQFLAGALDRGFLGAPNNDRLKFALMWANHDWKNIFPAKLGIPAQMLAPGKVTKAGFERICDHIIARYFAHPSYLRINGCPYFSIFDLATFVESCGGLDGARAAIETLQFKTACANLPGVHLNAMVWLFSHAPRWAAWGGVEKVVATLGIDSVAAYNWYDHYDLAKDTFPRGSYQKAALANFAAWEEQTKKWPIPYIPNVTMGWDSSPRCCGTDKYEMRGYPWLPILDGNTPSAFRNALEHAKAFLAKHPHGLQMLTLNAWNEWTEGAYLLPDTEHGTAYLEVIKRTFTR